MQLHKVFRILFTAAVLTALLIPQLLVSAHGSTQEGDYQIEIGFFAALIALIAGITGVLAGIAGIAVALRRTKSSY